MGLLFDFITAVKMAEKETGNNSFCKTFSKMKIT